MPPHLASTVCFSERTNLSADSGEFASVCRCQESDLIETSVGVDRLWGSVSVGYVSEFEQEGCTECTEYIGQE